MPPFSQISSNLILVTFCCYSHIKEQINTIKQFLTIFLGMLITFINYYYAAETIMMKQKYVLIYESKNHNTYIPLWYQKSTGHW